MSSVSSDLLLQTDAENTSGGVKKIVEEPAFTAYHGWQKGCIDYIFYHSKGLKVRVVSDSGQEDLFKTRMI